MFEMPIPSIRPPTREEGVMSEAIVSRVRREKMSQALKVGGSFAILYHRYPLGNTSTRTQDPLTFNSSWKERPR